MRHLPTALLLLGALAGIAPAADQPDYRFKVETLIEGMPQPMELEIAPDGRIFFNEFKGALRIYQPKTKQVIEAGTLEVFNAQENGFLGFALDPNFATNGWIYCSTHRKTSMGST